MDPVVVCMRMPLHRVIYLNSLSPVGETVWERLGCVVLFGEICHFTRGECWDFKSPHNGHTILSSLCLVLMD